MTLFRDAARCRQARVRHRDEQYRADRSLSTPVVHERPQTEHATGASCCIAATRARALSSARQRRDLHRDEQNTAVAAIPADSGSPHSRQYRRATSPDATTPIIRPIEDHDQPSKTGTKLDL